MRSRLLPLALILLALSPCWSAQMEKFSLRHMDAQAIADWMRKELGAKGEVLGLRAEQIERIDCVPAENALVVSAEEAAMDRIRALLAMLDEPIEKIQIDCKMVQLEQPELLLGGAPGRTVVLGEGLTVEVPLTAILGAAGQPPGAEEERHGLLAINPHVDLDLLADLLESGRVTIVNEPRILLLQGAPGAMAFVTEHEGEVYQKSVGFTAFMTDVDLVTVEASLHFHEPPGQTVAIGVLPQAEAAEGEPALVFLITAEPIRDVGM